MDDDVVIVAIDDNSLHQFGPWPWSRALQGQLISEIARQQPKRLLIDIVYTGDNPENQTLVTAAGRISELGLPMMIDTLAQGQQLIEVLPFPELLTEAELIGHVHIERDEDAIVRGTYLYQGVGEAAWPHLMLTAVEGFEVTTDCTEANTSFFSLAKCHYVKIPFAGPPGTYPQVSATHLLTSDVVQPEVLRDALANKTVLLGVTALGGTDWVTSPLGGSSMPLSGVEFNANLLSALRLGSTIRQFPDWAIISIGILLTGLLSLVIPRLRPKQAIGFSLAVAIVPLIVSALCLSLLWLHLPLANITIATLFIYPLWSWRRNEIAWGYIQGELSRMEQEESKWQLSRNKHDETSTHRALQLLLNAHITLPDNENSAALVHRDTALTEAEQALLNEHLNAMSASSTEEAVPAEQLAAQISGLEARARTLREGRDIGLAGLDRMSNGAMIITDLGQVRFINKSAAEMLAWDEDKDLLKQLEPISTPLGQNWRDIWRACVLDRKTVTFESELNGHPIVLTAAPLLLPEDHDYASSWVLTMADLSEIRHVEAQREEALAFLSHDLRSPLASILALIQQSRSKDQNNPASNGSESNGQSTLLDDIYRYTQKGLSTSDQFLQLSRLELHPSFETYPLELEQLVQNSAEQVYFLAREKNIAIKTDLDDDVWIEGNGELLERAIVNLIGNAIKYSDPDTTISISLKAIANSANIIISDQGYGIPEDEIRHIFEPFFRSAEPALAQNRGAGLGLRFVKTVIERHKGDISVNSTWGKGTTFQIRLPATE